MNLALYLIKKAVQLEDAACVLSLEDLLQHNWPAALSTTAAMQW